MKTLKFLTLLVFLFGLFSCDKSEDLNNIEVNGYIALLKDGKYDSMDLPSFTYKDIPALLEYRNEHQIITGFPRFWDCFFISLKCGDIECAKDSKGN